MGVTVANSAYILKTLWPQSRVENTVYQDHPFLAMVPKSEGFHGENMVIAVRYADSQGRSASFSAAQAMIGNHQGIKFTLTRVPDYQLVSLATEAILAAENDKGALIRNLDTEMASGYNNLSASLARALQGNGKGAVGRRGSVSGSTLTMKNLSDIAKIEKGMQLGASGTDGGALRGSPSYITVTAVDRDAGTFTFSGSIASFADDDYLFPRGDGANGSSNVRVSGLPAWLPAAAPTSGDSFFGADRSVDATRLAGLRIDISDLAPEEGLVTVLSKQSREGGRPSHLFTNHLDFRNIEISLQSKVVYEPLSVGGVGFTALKVIGPKGPVRVVADQDCSSGVGYSLQLDTWKLHSLGKLIRVLDLDGNKLSREGTADAWEARLAFFGNLACTFPGANANVVMSS